MQSEIEAARERIDALTLAISVRSIPRILEPLLRTKLTIQQLKTLTAIVVANGTTTSDLVAQFEVSMATMSKLLDRLVDQSLVERVADARDQRVKRLIGTQLGRDVVAELMAVRPELGADVIQGLTLAELEALELGMRAINRELQRLTGES